MKWLANNLQTLRSVGYIFKECRIKPSKNPFMRMIFHFIRYFGVSTDFLGHVTSILSQVMRLASTRQS